MCVLHIKPLVSRRHPAHLVFVLILHPSEMQICGHKTTMRRYYIVMQYVKGVDNAMPCHLTGYDRHIIRTPAYIPGTCDLVRYRYLVQYRYLVIWHEQFSPFGEHEAPYSSTLLCLVTN